MAITFGSAGHLQLVLDAELVSPAIGARAMREVAREPARTAVHEAVKAGRLQIQAIDLTKGDEVKALARFDADPAFRGRGDAEVLALAEQRGYLVGTDDRAIRTAAMKAIGAARLVSTLDVLVWARRQSRLSAAQAKKILRQLDIGSEIERQLQRAGIGIEDLV
jgi:hypothetical protein